MDIRKINDVINIYKKAGYKAYLVGGSSRDLLFSRDTNDIDIATNAPLSFTKNNFEVFDNQGEKMGSLHIDYRHTKMDITCFRKEIYENDKTYPKVEKFIQDEEEDASRRDYTVNAIYLDTTSNRIVDPYHGLEDLMKYTLRMIGDPTIRIKEDPTRIIRGLRLAYKYNFSIEEKTNEAFNNLKEELNRLSDGRFQKEIKKMIEDLGIDKTKKVLTQYKIDRSFEYDN